MIKRLVIFLISVLFSLINVYSDILEFTGAIEYEHFRTPAGVTLTDEHVFVLDSRTKYIYRFDINGNFQLKFGGEEFFSMPVDIESDGFNNIYILDSHLNVVKRFDINGVYTGISAQRLDHPSDIFRDREGRFIISDFGSRKIKIYTHDWRLYEEFTVYDTDMRPFNPTAASIFNNEVYVSDWSGNRVNIYNMKGVLKRSVGKEVLDKGDFYKIEGICGDSDERIYLLDWGNSRIIALEKDMRFAGSFGGFGKSSNNLRYPQDMKIYDNRLYVADSMNRNIKILEIDVKPQLFIKVSNILVPSFPKVSIVFEHNIPDFDIDSLEINLNGKKIDIAEISQDKTIVTIEFPVELIDKKVDFYGIYNYNNQNKIRFEKKIRLENQR